MDERLPPPPPRHDWLITIGMTISAIAAAVSSFNGLRSLALAAGWGTKLSALLPLTVDAYALTATRVWLTSPGGARSARQFARWNAIGAVLLSIIGNAVWHLVAAHLLAVSWPTVVIVGAVPAAVLGLLSHLAVLRSHHAYQLPPPRPDGPAAPLSALPSPAVPMPSADPTPLPQPQPAQQAIPSPRTTSPKPEGRPYPTEEAVLAAAQAADRAYRAAHDGRPITRDALRRELRVSAQRASAVLRQLRTEPKPYS